MGVYNHWGGAGNCGDGGDRGVYLPTPEHGCTVHCKLYYHGLMSGGGAESGTAPIQEMMGAASTGYTGDKDRKCRSGGGRGYGDRRIGGGGRVG